MIAITETTLPPEDEKEIKAWLQQPACRKFQEYLCNCAANGVAAAANELGTLEPFDRIEVLAEDVRPTIVAAVMHRKIALALQKMSLNDYHFRPVKLDTMPLTNEATTPNEE